jgi:hypothetical protein
VSDEIPSEDVARNDQPASPLLPPPSSRPRWQSIALAVGAVLLGVGVVIGIAVISGGLKLTGTAGPSASGQLPSAASSSSTRPSQAAPTSTPSGTPRPVNSTLSILRAQPPAEIPSITCSGSIGASDPVAIVELRPNDPSAAAPEVLRDYADLAHPRTACTSPSWQAAQLIDAHHVVVGGGGGLSALVELPEVRFQWFQLPNSETVASEFIAVSPELDEIVWLKATPNNDTGYYTKREIHITAAAGDTLVATLPDEPTGFCGAPLDSSKRGAFSHSGEHLYVLDQPRDLQGSGSQYSLRIFEGTTLVHSVVPPSGGWPAGEHPAFPVWSPVSETLYYRLGNDVWRWMPGAGASRFLTGVRWFNSTISPDGRHVAYALTGADGSTDAYLANLPVPGQPLRIGPFIGGPVFLNNTQLWLITQVVHGCAGGEGPKPVIYNVDAHSTAPSIIQGVFLVWPATSSSY